MNIDNSNNRLINQILKKRMISDLLIIFLNLNYIKLMIYKPKKSFFNLVRGPRDTIFVNTLI